MAVNGIEDVQVHPPANEADLSWLAASFEPLFGAMGLQLLKREATPRHGALPIFGWNPETGCDLVYGRTPDGLWMTGGTAGAQQLRELPANAKYIDRVEITLALH